LLNAANHPYRVSAARAQAEPDAAALASVEQKDALDVWKSYQELGTETANVKTSDDFFQVETHSFNVAQGRYKGGVGTIIELISAQSAVANATQQ
jgi:outer membrane protein